MFALAHTHFIQGVLSKGWNFTCSYVVLVVFLPSGGISPFSPEKYLSPGEKGVRHLQVLSSPLPGHISFMLDHRHRAECLQSVVANNKLCFLLGKSALRIVTGQNLELIISTMHAWKIVVFRLGLRSCLSWFSRITRMCSSFLWFIMEWKWQRIKKTGLENADLKEWLATYKPK